MADPAEKQAEFETKIQSFVSMHEGPPYLCPDAVSESMIMVISPRFMPARRARDFQFRHAIRGNTPT